MATRSPSFRRLKRLALVLPLVLLAPFAVASFRSTVKLEWYMKAGQMVPDAYILHATNSLTVPLDSWPVYTTFLEPLAGNSNLIYFTNNVTNQVTVPVDQVGTGVLFFYVTSSNVLGESLPSNLTWVPPQPQLPTLKIK